MSSLGTALLLFGGVFVCGVAFIVFLNLKLRHDNKIFEEQMNQYRRS